jgi:hypothetical protein
VKAPEAGNPLPKGEGNDPLHVKTPNWMACGAPRVICWQEAGATAKFENKHMFISEPNGAMQ